MRTMDVEALPIREGALTLAFARRLDFSGHAILVVLWQPRVRPVKPFFLRTERQGFERFRIFGQRIVEEYVVILQVGVEFFRLVGIDAAQSPRGQGGHVRNVVVV